MIFVAEHGVGSVSATMVAREIYESRFALDGRREPG